MFDFTNYLFLFSQIFIKINNINYEIKTLRLCDVIRR